MFINSNLSKKKRSYNKKVTSNLKTPILLGVFLVAVFLGLLYLSPFEGFGLFSKKDDLSSLAASKTVIANLVYWDKARGMESVKNHQDVFTTVSMWAYTIDTAGNVIVDPSGGGTTVDDATLTTLRSYNKKIIPHIHNLIGGSWNPQIIHDIITNPTKTDFHINNIVNLAKTKNYDGISIDYENLFETDRNAYSAFIAKLAVAMHNNGKTLSVDVYGKTSEPGNWSGQRAQDYAALGASVDELRIFLYDYNPGVIMPQAPFKWTDDVLAFAKTKVSANKIIHGLPMYGYDWNTNNPGDRKDYTWEQSKAVASQYNAVVNWDDIDKVNWYEYITGGIKRKVYFEDSKSFAAKLDLSVKHDIGGIHLWRLGGEDQATYNFIKSKFIPSPSPSTSTTPIASATPSPRITPTPTPISTPATSPSPNPSDTIPPTVKITAPADGSSIGRRSIKVQVSASDNVGVNRVMLYMNSKLVTTDYSAPFEDWWSFKKLPAGIYTLKAVAYDNDGNSAISQITVYK